MKFLQLYFLMLLFGPSLNAQYKLTPEQDSILKEIRKLTAADYQSMLDQLDIDSVRQGANGMDLEAPNAANYDESLANPYPDYPDPLKFNNGDTVKDAKEWWKLRRPEIAAAFEREIYGKLPVSQLEVEWKLVEEVKETKGAFQVFTKRLLGTVDNSIYADIKVDIELEITIPANAMGAVPLILQFGFKWPPWFNFPERPDFIPEWQLQLLTKGWGYAIIQAGSIQADNGAGLREGVIGLHNRGLERKPEDWGALRAWAWGAGKAMEYFVADEAIDERKIGITGHSRYGKAAVVAMAFDERFAIGYISSSGAGGVKPHRRNFGEIVENVAGSGEYHWMAGNYIKYAGPLGWDDLPVDSHELLALCAPRPVFVGAGDKGDEWVDQYGMFIACVKAGKVYELLDKRGLESEVYPDLDVDLIGGGIGFRRHSGGHTPGPNWEAFITFASRYFD